MNTCKTCVHWQEEKTNYVGVHRLVKQCTKMQMRDDSTHWDPEYYVNGMVNPNAVEVLNDGVMAFVNDGSDYFAALYTTPEFGCVQWEGE